MPARNVALWFTSARPTRMPVAVSTWGSAPIGAGELRIEPTEPL